MQLNYSFHGNQWRKSNKSSSLQALRAFQKPWHSQAGVCTRVAAGGWHRHTPECHQAFVLGNISLHMWQKRWNHK